MIKEGITEDTKQKDKRTGKNQRSEMIKDTKQSGSNPTKTQIK